MQGDSLQLDEKWLPARDWILQLSSTEALGEHTPESPLTFPLQTQL